MKQWLKILDNDTVETFKTSCKWIDAGMGTKASSVKFKNTQEVCSLCYDTITKEMFILKEV